MAEILQRKTGSQCVAVVKSALDDIVKGRAQNASTKLRELKGDSAHLVAKAAELTTRLEMVEDHHISKQEELQREIGNLGCQEEALRQQKNSEETKLASNRSVLWDNESRLRSAESDVESAKRKLEQARRDEEESLQTGAIVGAIVGAPFFGVGALFGAALGTSVAGIVNAIKDEVASARSNLDRRREDCQRARSAVEESERRVASIRPQITSLERRMQALKMERLIHHEKVGEIKEAVVFLKDSLEFWELFKQAAEHGGQRTSLLRKIVDKANERGNYRALTSKSTKQVASTFLEAWDSIESLAIEGQRSHLLQIKFTCSNCNGHYTGLPYAHFFCVHCNNAIQN